MDNPNRETCTIGPGSGDAGSPLSSTPTSPTSMARRVSPSYVRPSLHFSSSDHCCPNNAVCLPACYHSSTPIPASYFVKLWSRNRHTSCSVCFALRSDGRARPGRRWLPRKTTLSLEKDETRATISDTGAPTTDAGASNGDIVLYPPIPPCLSFVRPLSAVLRPHPHYRHCVSPFTSPLSFPSSASPFSPPSPSLPSLPSLLHTRCP